MSAAFNLFGALVEAELQRAEHPAAHGQTDRAPTRDRRGHYEKALTKWVPFSTIRAKQRCMNGMRPAVWVLRDAR
jgi:hypothetical protein